MSLVSQLIENKSLKTPETIKAFEKVKRGDFVITDNVERVEADAPQEIGFGQTISQPSTVAFMIELCQPKPGNQVLDIGSGSGWTTALFSELVGPNGHVYGLERISELKDFGEQNAEKYQFVSSGRTVFLCRDGSQGLPEFAPYDIIHIGAAASELPTKLLSQLKIGGNLVVPVGVDTQEIYLVKKIDQKNYQIKKFPGFVFVPLIEG